jgi:hypothetical protein
MSKLWDRQSGETNRAYEALCAYLQLGPRRSLAKAAEVFYDGKSAGKVRHFERWSSQYEWVKRAEAWDEHQRALDAREYEIARREAKQSRLRALHDLQGLVIDAIGKLTAQAIAQGEFADIVRASKMIWEQQRIEYDEVPASKTDITSGGQPLGALTADLLARLDDEADEELDDFERQFEEGDE